MADGTPISKLVIDVEVNDKNAQRTLKSLQQNFGNFNKSVSSGSKGVDNIAKSMDNVAKSSSNAKREAGQFIETVKRNNKNILPKDLYGKSMSQYQKQLSNAQDKMKSIMSTSSPDRQLKGLERYTIQAEMARNAIAKLKEVESRRSSNVKNFWEEEGWFSKKQSEGKVSPSEFDRIRYQNAGTGGSVDTSRMNDFLNGTVKSLDDISSKASSVGAKVREVLMFEPSKLGYGESFTKPYLELEKEITKAETKLENLYTKQEQMANAKPGTERFVKLQTDIKKAEMELDGLNIKMKELQQSGGDKKGGIFSAIESLGKIDKSIGSFRKSISGISKEFEKLPKKITKPILRLGTMFRAMILRRFIIQIFKQMKQAVDDLAKYSNTIGSDFNKSVSNIIANFKYLGRVIITAFEPLINFASPVLDFIVQKITVAINAINQFINAVVGNSTWTKAQYNASNYANSLDNASGSAKKLKQQLQGFDELNVLSSDNGNGGSGSGNGTANVGDLFSTEQVSSSASNMAEKFKQSWENADFTEVGEIVGSKITDALNNINWSGIKTTANKLASSIATFLNGAISPELFGAVGTTVAESLNTVLGATNTFLGKFNFTNLGESVASGINTFFKDFKWELAAETINKMVDGLKDAIKAVFKNLSWKDILSGPLKFVDALELDTILLGLGAFAWFYGGKQLALSALNTILATEIPAGVGKLTCSLGASLGISVVVAVVGWKIGNKLYNDVPKVQEMSDALVELTAGLFTQEYKISEVFKAGADMELDLVATVTNFFNKDKKPLTGEDIKKALINAGITVLELPITVKGKIDEVLGDWKKLKKNESKKISLSAVVSGNDKLKKLKSTFDDLIAKKNEIEKAIKISFNDNFTTPIKKAWNKLADSINSFIDKIPVVGTKIASVPKFSDAKKDGGAFFGGAWHSISQYANGGLPSHGTAFVAGEAGPEVVGNIGGRTEVLNQSQLASTMYSAVLSAMKNASGNQQPIQVYLDGKVVFDSTRSYAQDYYRRTGNMPYPA